MATIAAANSAVRRPSKAPTSRGRASSCHATPAVAPMSPPTTTCARVWYPARTRYMAAAVESEISVAASTIRYGRVLRSSTAVR
eukprot:CAMPEP_0119418994 /NCGR_PEP_ID=MMETSP1335-20130426/19682_1 /TAXON_ID=259385 /ORGANISM="Chrysoculter rhomboideus, Strain RCC1486" /LENGTH=83 /DNA_ID=CAMNT_0007444269 /DNA_START=225 /DNA_END=476 /DNA_ORIENTATION=-